MTVAKKLNEVRERIKSAAKQAGRAPGSVKLLAVSKRKPEADIRAAYEAGQRDFGENYVQELREKAEALADLPDIRWHMIGQLQRNKIKYVTGTLYALHTLDSLRLTDALLKRLQSAQRGERGPLRTLIEVNVSGEESKSGCSPRDLGDILRAAQGSPDLTLCGLMTVPPRTDTPEDARRQFEELLALRDEHGGADLLPELSIGMSRDLEVAVSCGATWVRIGSAIFGER